MDFIFDFPKTVEATAAIMVVVDKLSKRTHFMEYNGVPRPPGGVNNRTENPGQCISPLRFLTETIV